VKCEEVYLHPYEDMDEAWPGLARYLGFYNGERPHQALAWRTPHDVCFGTQEAHGDSAIADAAVTAVGLHPPSVTAAPQTLFLEPPQQWV